MHLESRAYWSRYLRLPTRPQVLIGLGAGAVLHPDAALASDSCEICRTAGSHAVRAAASRPTAAVTLMPTPCRVLTVRADHARSGINDIRRQQARKSH